MKHSQYQVLPKLTESIPIGQPTILQSLFCLVSLFINDHKSESFKNHLLSHNLFIGIQHFHKGSKNEQNWQYLFISVLLVSAFNVTLFISVVSINDKIMHCRPGLRLALWHFRSTWVCPTLKSQKCLSKSVFCMNRATS